MVKLEAPRHTGHFLQYVRTVCNLTQVLISVVILVKVS